MSSQIVAIPATARPGINIGKTAIMALANDIKARFRLWGEDVRGSLMFLTRLPVGGPPLVMPRALRAFPFAGGLIGLLGALVLTGALEIGFSPLIGAILTLAAMAAVTGALHEDGLADTADGFGGGTDKEQKLKIMRESQIGTYGTITLVFTVGLRIAVVAELTATLAPLALGSALVAAGAAGRVAPVVVLMLLPAARPEGLGVSTGRPQTGVFLAAISAGAVLLLPVFATISIISLIVAVILSFVVTMAICELSRRQIGGQTGDVAGAAAILAETGFLTGLVV